MLTACVFAHFICSLAHSLICPFNRMRLTRHTRNKTEKANNTRAKKKIRTKRNYWMPKKATEDETSFLWHVSEASERKKKIHTNNIKRVSHTLTYHVNEKERKRLHTH